MKTPDEIKKGLKDGVPYHIHKGEAYLGCIALLETQRKMSAALAYIQQLEAANAELLTKVEHLEVENKLFMETIGLLHVTENQLETKCHQLEQERDALMHWARGRCDTCAHNDDCVKHDPDPEGLIVHWYDDCESWEWRGVEEE